MTAVIGYLDNDYPCLIGDIVISSTLNNKQNQLVLPFSGINTSQNPIWNGYRYITDLRQKLILIGPHMLVAWAGSYIEARVAIKEMRKIYKTVDVTNFSELEKTLDCLQDEDYKNLSLIALVANDEYWKLKKFGHEVNTLKSPWNENLVALGSGDKHLLEAIDREFERKNSDDISNVFSRLLCTAARMWSWELYGSSNELAFGGAYEIAIRHNNKVKKIGDILYINHLYTPEDGLFTIPIFVKVDYIREFLIIRVLEFQDNPDKNNKEELLIYKRAAMYITPPVDYSSSDELPSSQEINDELIDFKCDIICNTCISSFNI